MTKKEYVKPYSINWRKLIPILIMIVIGMAITFPLLTAANFDNKLSYENNDLKIKLENWFGLGKDLGTAEIKSHSSVEEVKKVWVGDQVVMWYEFEFIELYENGLGEVDFIDMKTGDLVEREYEFVYLDQENYDVEICESWKGNDCSSWITETRTKQVWTSYNSRDIPEGNIILGLKTEVKWTDHIDAVWEIGGKKATKHIQYSNLVIPQDNYQIFNETGNHNFTVPVGVSNVSALVVGGGGAGSTAGSAGGASGAGSGGVIYNVSIPVTTLTNVSVMVGDGGSLSGFTGENGTNSSFGTVIGLGGAGGVPQTDSGISGGSGSGGGGECAGCPGGIGNQPASSSGGLGNDGGDASPGTGGGQRNGGGGGGAGSVGEDGTNSDPGLGGDGITIFNITWAEGGDGKGDQNQTGPGGFPTNNSGSGGSAGQSANAQGGAAGIVIVAWNDPPIDLNITLISPLDNAELISQNVEFSANVTDPNGVGVQNVSINVSNSSGDVFVSTNTSGYEGIYNFSDTLADGTYSWTVSAFSDGDIRTLASENRTFIIDSSAPVLTTITPNETFTYLINGTTLYLSGFANDTNLDSCWYAYNGTNNSFSCTNLTLFNQSFLQKTAPQFNLTLWANDTFGNNASKFTSWEYLVFENERGFENSTIEGSIENYYLDFYIGSGSLSNANLWYNGSKTSSSFSLIDILRYNASIDNFAVPDVSDSAFATFFWEVNFDSNNVNTTSSNQYIFNISIDDCDINSITLYNFTISDEELQTIINNASIDISAEVEIQINSYATEESVLTFNQNFDTYNPFRVCLNSNLGTSNYNVDALIEYGAANYETEFYNIQNETINSTSLSQNITLRDLNSTDAQVFELIVRDSSYLAIDDAIIEIYRKYVDEGTYKIVEIPKSDAQGKTVGHLVVNDVIYQFVIKKYGETILTLSDVRATCQNPAIQTCQIDFNAFSSGIDIPNYQTSDDFNFTLDYNNNTRIIQSQFTIPSGNLSTVWLNVSTTDALGTSVCSDSLTSTTGTLSCAVPSTFGNSTILAKLYKDESLIGQGSIKLDQLPSDIYGGILVALALFVLLTLFGAAITDNPIVTTILMMVGVLFLFAINLVANNGFLGATATILWLLVAMLIVIIKGAKRN